MKAGEAALAGAGMVMMLIMGIMTESIKSTHEPVDRVVIAPAKPSIAPVQCDESMRVAGITTCLWDYFKLNPKRTKFTFSSDAEAFKDCEYAADDQFCKWSDQ